MTLEEIKDQVANENYSTPYWIWLNDSQRASLVDIVATQFAIEELNKSLESMTKVFSNNT